MPIEPPAWLRQAATFGLVGLLATLSHVAVYSALGAAGLDVQLANLLAFLAALPVSLFGNARFTFAARIDLGALLRFLAVALGGLALNHLNVVLVAVLFRLPWQAALPGMLFVVPALLFAANKFWVYRPRS